MDEIPSTLFGFRLALAVPGKVAFAPRFSKAMVQRLYTPAPDGLPRLPQNYAECVEYIRSDYFRYTGRRASLPRMWLYGLRNPAFGFSFWLRLSAHRGWLYPLTRLLHRRYARRYGLQIYPTTRIGFGLYVRHAFGTIVNPTAVIGHNVNLSQFTTAGSNRGEAAVIGDCVLRGAYRLPRRKRQGRRGRHGGGRRCRHPRRPARHDGGRRPSSRRQVHQPPRVHRQPLAGNRTGRGIKTGVRRTSRATDALLSSYAHHVTPALAEKGNPAFQILTTPWGSSPKTPGPIMAARTITSACFDYFPRPPCSAFRDSRSMISCSSKYRRATCSAVRNLRYSSKYFTRRSSSC